MKKCEFCDETRLSDWAEGELACFSLWAKCHEKFLSERSEDALEALGDRFLGGGWE